MTTTDAARLAHMTTKGIQSAIHRGRLPAVKVGRDWQIDPKDFDKWLSQAQHTPGRKAKAK